MSGAYPTPLVPSTTSGVSRVPLAPLPKSVSDGDAYIRQNDSIINEMYRTKVLYELPAGSAMDWEAIRNNEIADYTTKIFENLEKTRNKRRLGRMKSDVIKEGQALREQNWKNMLLDLQRGNSVLGEMSFTSRLLFDRTISVKPIYGN